MPKSSNRKHQTRRDNRDRRQRLEQMRQQQKAAERRKNFLFAGSAVVVALILIGAAVIPAYLHDRSEKAKSKAGYQASPTSAEKAAGCDGVHNDVVSPPGQHVPNKAIDYTKEKFGDTRDGATPIPPSGGSHNPIPLGVQKTRFFDVAEKPRPERAVHNLEHGYVVGWYDSKLPAADVDELKKLAADQSLSNFLAVGWFQGDLPQGKHFVLTSWGRTDRCTSVSDDVVRQFYSKHQSDQKLAPEVGSGDMGGDQFPPNSLLTTPAASASASPTAQPSSTFTTNINKKKKGGK